MAMHFQKHAYGPSALFGAMTESDIQLPSIGEVPLTPTADFFGFFFVLDNSCDVLGF